MNDPEIVRHIKKLFDPSTSPGTAFDALFVMRQHRVMYQDVFNAIQRCGSALDQNEDAPGMPVKAPRLSKARPEDKGTPVFKNPVLSFGKHNGKHLKDVVLLDPAYVDWMEREHESEFWRVQARLAKFAAAAEAPHYRDTDATGYFD